MNETKIKLEMLEAHFRDYFPSLKNYPESYLPLFNYTSDSAPAHLAYLCPLCLNKGILVTEENGLCMHSEFSPDHFPPRCVGGFESLLVCTSCNSEAGKNYDFSLKQKIKDIAFAKRIPAASMVSKRSEIKKPVSDVVGKYPALFTIGENGDFELSLKPFPIHAPYLDEFIEYSKTNHDYKLTMNIQMADDTKVSKAALKAAYLNCFYLWGYEFIFSYSAGMIRKVLNGELEYPIKCPTFYLGNILKSDIGLKLPKGICYLKSPLEWRSFIVNMAMTDEDTGFSEIITVMIPGPNKENWEELKRIQKLLDVFLEQDINMIQAIEFNISNSSTAYTDSWEILHND